MKRTVVAICIIIPIMLVVAWFALPQKVQTILLTINNMSAGLTMKSIDLPFGRVHYLEGGRTQYEAETVVLLHGVFARKEHWVDLARELTPHFHVIALDLPGFGDNDPLSPDHYLLKNQAQNLRSVLASLGISKAHFGANSMGAQIAGLLAIEQPELFQSLAFIGSPLGVKGKVKSDMEIAIENGHIPLLARTESEFNQRNAWLFPITPTLPSPILKTWMKQEISTPEQNENIWHAANSFIDTPTLMKLAPQLEMPTLIIWCKEDRIFHVSGADVLDAKLPNSSRKILYECGHLPMLDKAELVAHLYLVFLHEIGH
ncbi:MULTISPECIES: alpha/beta hydrolase [unclassified Alteromonas]|uniref:alpha/beta fold hydrolase n=1 Tax=unclassified Alteromonas TaxID=2614992 RepID=UPI001EF2C8E6|nr:MULTISPECIES: alpha/beta hydrolase [unclassified Alteromonas]MCG7638021.1 alpha/beta hydrolase [Alteromonas sp. CNT1-28]MCG7813305.1 alpha/beta hydrolase [Alteromonas sp. MCA-1]